ncbi:MAG: hypothetical protein K0R75_2892, partial [Paenibacillaceae bacterium]|nr:hypothetical protein [Paenibacillaceae bacterium]
MALDRNLYLILVGLKLKKVLGCIELGEP